MALKEEVKRETAAEEAVILQRSLQQLDRGQQLNQTLLRLLADRRLIEVQEVSDTAVGHCNLIFTFFTESGRRLLGD
jgi:hypothetical protein